MMNRFIEDWQKLGVDAWNEIPNHWLPQSGHAVGWWTLPQYLGDQFIAPFLGVPAATCILLPNVHWIVQCLLSSRELFSTQKNKVILTGAEFPSVLHSVQQWADVYGIDVQVLPLKNDSVQKNALIRAIDARTALVFLSHVGFTTGEKLPDDFLYNVAQQVHKQGGLLAIDGYHSIGASTTPVTELEADIYFGGLLKEASGSSGNAFLYLRKGLHLTPRMTGWFGDASPFAFHSAPEPHPEARIRFLGGTISVAPLYHSVEGLRLLLSKGLDAVRADSLQKTDYTIHRARLAGITVHSPVEQEHRSAMVILSIPHADKLSLYLKSRHVYTDSRKSSLLRIAPFTWNTMEEIGRLFDLLEVAVHDKVYTQIETTQKSGPVT